MADTDEQPLHSKDSTAERGLVRPTKRRSCTAFCCYKFLVLIYGILFFAVGTVLLVIGAWALAIKKDFESINDVISSPAILALVIGLVMMASAVTGIIGAFYEKLWPLRVFIVIAILVFLLQVVVGILAFVYREQTGKFANEQFVFAIKDYSVNADVRHSVDAIQRKFECCGLKGPNDWNKNKNYSCSEMQSPLHCSVPASCCVNPEADIHCGLGIRSRTSSLDNLDIHNRGCSKLFGLWVERNLDIVGGTGLGFALLHVLGIFFTYILITKVEDRGLLFKYKDRYNY